MNDYYPDDTPLWLKIFTAPFVFGVVLVNSRRFQPLPQIAALIYFTALIFLLSLPFVWLS